MGGYSKTRLTQQSGTRANQPAASAVQVGTLYMVTDEYVVERSDGSSWNFYASAGAALDTVDHGDVTFGGTGSMTFTVSSGELLRYNFAIVHPRLVWIDIGILAADVGGTASTGLQVSAPPGLDFGPTDVFGGNGVESDDAFANQFGCQVISRASSDVIEVKKLDGANWATGTGTLSFFVSILALLAEP